ncbi:MAG: hypothetical protein JXB10_16060 [Pirellulales bacterium]|nr:hypothetical protein [Pirellulales bacterium]
MSEVNHPVVRSVAWSELLPWLILVRSFRLVLSINGLGMIVLGAIAVFLMTLGWWFFGSIFSTDSGHPATAWLEPYANCPWLAATETVPDTPPILYGVQPSLDTRQEPFTDSWRLLSRPLWKALYHPSFLDLLCLTLCGLWSLAVWSYFGAAITRIAAVQLATGEHVPLTAALRFAGRHYLSYFGAPWFPLAGAAIVTVLMFALAWLLHWGAGVLIAGLLWFLLLIGGLVLTLILVGLFFGWPMIWGTISTEGSDAYDALSRSYAYVYQRPLHYVFYVAVAAGLGWLAWFFVQNFAAAIIYLTYWAASWVTGTGLISTIQNGQELNSSLGNAGVAIIHFWTGCVKLLAVGFGLAYFFSAATAIYLLQRRQVDATEMDEVFLDADADEPESNLPPIVTDAAGAPEVQENAPPESEEKPAGE